MKTILFGEDIFSATTLQSLINSGYNVPLVICPYRENDSNYNNDDGDDDGNKDDNIRPSITQQMINP